MTEYAINIINDQGFYLFVIAFSGLFLSVFLIGFFINLVITLLYKLSHKS